MWLSTLQPKEEGCLNTLRQPFLFNFSYPTLLNATMNVTIKTKVPGNYRTVIQQFDRQLFEALAPPVAKMEIVEFTGSKKGDRVHIRFVSPFKVEWISEITEDQITESKAWFTDEGVQLPWPLRYWKHQHIVEKVDEKTSVIIDDITFRGPNWLISLFLYPGILFGFLPRKRIYKNYFSSKQT
jgi:ligand-binding SRPBCC domain-containing protein